MCSVRNKIHGLSIEDEEKTTTAAEVRRGRKEGRNQAGLLLCGRVIYVPVCGNEYLIERPEQWPVIKVPPRDILRPCFHLNGGIKKELVS